MKIARLGGIALALMLLLPTSQSMASELYQAYKIYKDPVARAQALEQMRVARERLQANMKYAQEKGLDAWKNIKDYIQAYKKQLIAGVVGATLIIVSAALGRMKYSAAKQKEMIDRVNTAIEVYRIPLNAVTTESEKVIRSYLLAVQTFATREEFERWIRSNADIGIFYSDEMLIDGLRTALDTLLGAAIARKK